jgi:uncharacterized protein Veg
MNIAKIRENLEVQKGKLIHFKYNGARNQIEEFNGVIENIYPAIFTIRLNEENNKLKSFTYSDVLTEILELFIE